MVYLKLWCVLGAFCWVSEFPGFWEQIQERERGDRFPLSVILSAFSFFCWPVILFFWLRRISFLIFPPRNGQNPGKEADR